MEQNIPASFLVLLKENKILLLRRYNTGYEDGNYSMVSGHVDPGESFAHAIVREAQEEAGITLNVKDVQLVHFMHRKKPDGEQRIDVFFAAQKWEGEIVNTEPHKCDDLSWFDLDNLPQNIIPYIRQAIEAIKKGEYYSEFGW